MTYSDVLDQLLPEEFRYFMTDEGDAGVWKIRITITDGTIAITESVPVDDGFELLIKKVLTSLISIGIRA